MTTDKKYIFQHKLYINKNVLTYFVVIKRKLIKHGNSSLTISLPSSWTRRYNLKKGDEINLEDSKSMLLISTEKPYPTYKTEIDVSSLDVLSIRWEIEALHKSGCDEIKVSYSTPEQIETIQDTVDGLIGFAMVEQNERACIIKSVTELMDSEFDSVFRRLFLITITIAELSHESLKNKDRKGLSEAIKMRSKAVSLMCFCQRILNKKGYTDASKTSYYYMIACCLGSIADKYKENLEFILENRLPLDHTQGIIDMSEKVKNFLRDFYDLVYRLSDEKIQHMSFESEETKMMMMRFLKERSLSGENISETEIMLLGCFNTVVDIVRSSTTSVIGLRE